MRMRLTIISSVGYDSNGNALVKCKCLCGNEVINRKERVKSQRVKSCNHCNDAEKYPKEHNSYRGMLNRCYTVKPGNRLYSYYRGKGIIVCQRWRIDFFNFLEDMGRCPDGKTLDRKDGNKNYEKENCRWATQTEQIANRKTNLQKQVLLKQEDLSNPEAL